MLEKRFHKINIEISNICNLQCSFCPEVIRDKGLMPVELFTNIIDQVSSLTELVCFHLMGDPLVHPKLKEMVQICGDRGVKIFLVTNGVLLKEKQVEALLLPALHQVNFSLHSFFDNFPEKDPTDYLEKIFAFSDRALQERPDLYQNFRLWNLREHRGTGKNRDILAKIEEHYGPLDLSTVDVKRKKSIRIKNRLYLHFDSEFIWPSMSLPEIGERGTCYGLTSHFGILVDGTVVPCCLDKEGNIPLGRVQDDSIEAILNSPKATKILNGFKANRLEMDLCKRCDYIQRFK